MGDKPTYEQLEQRVRELERRSEEARRVEEALRESQELLENILTASAVGIAYARDRKIVWANQAMAELFGFTREEQYLGKDTRILYADDAEYRRVGQLTYEQQKSGKLMKLDAKLRHQDGHLFDGYVRVNILDPLDPIKGISVSIIDISDRKRAEEALRESEEKYRALIENANEAIFVAQDGMIKFANSRTEENIGYSEEDLVDRIPFTDLIHPEDRDMVLDRHKRRLTGEDLPSTYSFRVINKNGEELWGQLNTVTINWDGRPATLNFLRDITQQRKLESQFQQAQKLEAIGTLAGGIAHDFNNLLMGIQGNTSLVLLDMDSRHPHYERLKNIEHYVQSGAELTRQLLGFARGGKYQVKTTDLNDLINESARMFGRTAKNIRIHKELQANLWPVEVDQGQIDQILLNLYVNAWHAMPAGGDLFIHTENIVLDQEYVRPFGVQPGKYVKISITDTGVGMDKATLERLFEPFFTTKEMGRGSGLGLASVYGIIKNHGGFINVYSEKGQGATFNIYLPASEVGIVEEEKPTREVLRGEGTILLVDDEDMIIDIGKLLLEELGYRVMVAKSGRQAITLYEKNRVYIQMVILDMIMPGMGGGETYDRLKEIDPGVKVLLSSGYSINGQAQEILERGCNGFIQKPFNLRELSLKVGEILNQP